MSTSPDGVALRAPSPRVRRIAAATTVALVVAATLATSAGREAAASFLAQFRSERIQVVTFDAGQGVSPLEALGALGTVESDPHAGAVVPVGSLDEAQRRTGLAVDGVDPATLPEGFDQQAPRVLVAEAAQVRITFDAARVQAWLDQHGSDLAVPEGIGASVLTVQLPAAVAQTFHGRDFGQFVVGQSRLVTATAEGPLSLDDLRDFVLELPGLEPGLTEQLRAIGDWRTTLPLPVPAGELDWRDTTVGSTPAVELQASHGLGSALVWQDDGVVHGVGGMVDSDAVRQVAERLAP